MGTDKSGDVLWVGDSWGSSLARIDTKTNAVTMIPFRIRRCSLITSTSTASITYGANLWTNDQIFKYDPSAQKWTLFELPVRGTEMRHLSVRRA